MHASLSCKTEKLGLFVDKSVYVIKSKSKIKIETGKTTIHKGILVTSAHFGGSEWQVVQTKKKYKH